MLSAILSISHTVFENSSSPGLSALGRTALVFSPCVSVTGVSVCTGAGAVVTAVSVTFSGSLDGSDMLSVSAFDELISGIFSDEASAILLSERSRLSSFKLSETLLSGAEVAEAVLLASPVVVVSAVVSAVVVVAAFELLSPPQPPQFPLSL